MITGTNFHEKIGNFPVFPLDNILQLGFLRKPRLAFLSLVRENWVLLPK